jgi:hypothetical protein
MDGAGGAREDDDTTYLVPLLRVHGMVHRFGRHVGLDFFTTMGTMEQNRL